MKIQQIYHEDVVCALVLARDDPHISPPEISARAVKRAMANNYQHIVIVPGDAPPDLLARFIYQLAQEIGARNIYVDRGNGRAINLALTDEVDLEGDPVDIPFTPDSIMPRFKEVF